MSQDEFVANASQVVQSIQKDTCVIEKDGQVVAALVSPDDYEAVRQLRVRKALAALDELREAIQAKNPSEEELLELEKALDRKAPS